MVLWRSKKLGYFEGGKRLLNPKAGGHKSCEKKKKERVILPETQEENNFSTSYLLPRCLLREGCKGGWNFFWQRVEKVGNNLGSDSAGWRLKLSFLCVCVGGVMFHKSTEKFWKIEISCYFFPFFVA